VPGAFASTLTRVVDAPVAYAYLVKLIQALGVGKCTVITFNYDIAADYAFQLNRVPFTYCLTDEIDGEVRIPILKLHGSLNWGRCSIPSCGLITNQSGRAEPEMIDNKIALLRCSRHFARMTCRVCAGPVEPEPVIVPPTWNKGEYHLTLGPVWQRAAAELSRANNIFVFGYSLPTVDSFFRSLYALGSVGSPMLKRFIVHDIDEAVHSRFLSILGPGAIAAFQESREEFQVALRSLSIHLLGYGV